MKEYTYTVVEYEQSDFDKVKEEMTPKRAAEVLEKLPRGWFPYMLPEWSIKGKVDSTDLENYEICCAIDMAINALQHFVLEEAEHE